MIRKAQTENSEILTNIAVEAKRHWGYPESWIKHWEPQLTITPDYIDSNHVYVFEHDGEIRGFYALCEVDNKTELDHMWVLPAYIGSGIGKELFLDAMERAANMNVSEVELLADPNAAGFYEHMGAKQIGEVDAEIEGQPRKLPRMKIELK